MVHILLLLPVIGLILFWIFPINLALPIYVMVIVTSLILYFSIIKAMKLPVKTGEMGIVGLEGKVVNISGDVNLVSVHGEMWNAVSESPLAIGEIVRVTNVKELTLQVKKIKSGEKQI